MSSETKYLKFGGEIADAENPGEVEGASVDVVNVDTVTEWRWEDPVTRKDYAGHMKVVE